MKNTTSEVTTGVEFDDLDTDEVNRVIEETTIETPDGELSLGDVLMELAVAHKELEDYKKGALAMHQALDERLHEAEAAGDDIAVQVLSDTKKTAFGVYLRLQRGDLELRGDREGKYSGYYDEEEENTSS